MKKYQIEKDPRAVRMMLCFLMTACLGFFLTPNVLAEERVKFVQELTANLSKPVDVAVSDEGYIYVLDEMNASINLYDENGEYKNSFGEMGKGPGQFRRPKSIAITPQGKIVVADTGNNRIQVFNKIGKFLFQIGGPGSQAAHFKEPVAIIVDHFGYIFVADKGNRRVQTFTPNGLFIDSFDTESRPTDIGIDPQRNLYVMMPGIGKIVKYTSAGKELQEMSCVSGRKDFVAKASGLAVDDKGDVYITEVSEHSIKKLADNNEVLLSFGSRGNGRGQFDFAEGITSDGSGQVFIADSRNSRVQVLKVFGSTKETIPSTEKAPLALDFHSTISSGESIVSVSSVTGKGMYILYDKEDHIKIDGYEDKTLGGKGEGPGEFNRPMAMAVTLNGRIFVADSGNNRVQILKESGEFDYLFGKPGRRSGQFVNPQGIAVNSKGNIYVADTNNNRIQIFTYDGIYLDVIEAPRIKGLAGEDVELAFRSPRAIAIDSEDRVYVSDYQNNRVLVLSEEGYLLNVIGEKGAGDGQFHKPVHLAVDENDKLYVADQGNHRIQIFDSEGKFVQAFGAPGSGRGCFKQLSAITVFEGKIYASDYLNDEIQVFALSPGGRSEEERIYATQSAYPPDDTEVNEIAKYAIAKRLATQNAIEELIAHLSISKKYLKNFISIESVEILRDTRVKVTVSMPKTIPLRRGFPLEPLESQGGDDEDAAENIVNVLDGVSDSF